MWGFPQAERLPKCQELYFLVDHWNLIINRPVGPITRLSYNQQITKTVLNYGLWEQLKNWKANSFLRHCSPTCHNTWAALESRNLMQGTACVWTNIFNTSEPWNPQCMWSHLPIPLVSIMKISALPASLPHTPVAPASSFVAVNTSDDKDTNAEVSKVIKTELGLFTQLWGATLQQPNEDVFSTCQEEPQRGRYLKQGSSSHRKGQTHTSSPVWVPSASSSSSQGAGRGCGHSLGLSCNDVGGWVYSS